MMGQVAEHNGMQHLEILVSNFVAYFFEGFRFPWQDERSAIYPGLERGAYRHVSCPIDFFPHLHKFFFCSRFALHH